MTLLGTLPRCHETTAQQTVRLFFGKLATSLRRNEVLRKHTPRHQVVLIALHAGHGDVGGSPAERPVQPNGNVAQGGSLYLRDGARIPKSHREGRDSAVLLNVLRAQVDCQRLACHGRDVETHACGVIILDHSRHAVDKVVPLVDVPSEEDALALEDLSTAGLQRALLQPPMRLEVCLVGVVVHGNDAQGILVAVVEEDLCRQAVH